MLYKTYPSVEAVTMATFPSNFLPAAVDMALRELELARLRSLLNISRWNGIANYLAPPTISFPAMHAAGLS